MNTRRMLMGAAAGLAASAALGRFLPAAAVTTATFTLTDAQWRSKLSAEQYNILRLSGTEYPFSSPLDKQFAAGRYDCVGCNQKLYLSQTKFDSGTGWPSFYQPLENAIVRRGDSTLGMERTEIRCGRCDGHLGHVFDDGPRPTGLRYCMNGAVLNFVPGATA